MYNQYIKRILDILFSIILIVLLVPFFIIIGIISLISTGGIIFIQKRDGLFKKSFKMYKFQSMKCGNTPKIMRIIRSIGLDELPQLFNILKGDMSFVGPRPFITGESLPIYPEQISYTVRPGIVSLAAANGRRHINHSKRLKYDYIYVTNVSFKLDVYIVFKTLKVLVEQNVRG